jgi:flagellar basal body rod protein FlgC
VSEFDVLAASAAGMDAQRAALNVAAQNVAAAETGTDFARLVPQFSVANGDVDEDASFADPDADGLVRFTGTRRQAGTSADAITEMIAILNAERAYEADASVFDAGKRLAERTIDVGRP